MSLQKRLANSLTLVMIGVIGLIILAWLIHMILR